MKSIKYTIMTEINLGTEDEPKISQVFNACEIQCSDDVFEANLAIAQREAHNGELTVEEIPETETEPTIEERVQTLETGKAEQSQVDELNEALEMILSGVTE